MGILSHLFGKTEARSATSDSYAEAFGISPTSSGAYVSPRLAENLATVSACIGAISSTMASLPAYVYRAHEDGREELHGHPVARLLRRPNTTQTWPDWMEWTMAQVLLHGNALSAIEYDARGQVTALLPIPWSSVQVSLLPSGRLVYDVTRVVAPWGGGGRPRRYLADEVFHLRDRSDDGLLGRSRISRAPEVLGNATALQEWSGTMWQNQATPSGILQAPGNVTEEQLARIRAVTDRNWSGVRNARKTLILTGGLEWKSVSVSPEDAEVLASRRFTVEELCRLFQVPPPIVQDYTHNTFTNSQQAALWFAQFSLTPWARKIEAEFARSVFGTSSADCTLEVDLSGLMRGDYEARWKAHEIAVKNQILDPNEVREVEGWNPRPVAAPPPAPRPEVV
ncbi:phage portal protein [Pseudoroseomonas rhizosphaerae]|uniref:Phage portal protein n=1 Tax=Teichococcus rhizosphaerae TaxID=1335062 RepID=A0A2C7A5A4_9PROT|nr:phage portal protein [Pseudoroseomonas rhizosphaerae]PHK93159.1 phage portal protein [Pseudoroseomonas rhizosphaerae]